MRVFLMAGAGRLKEWQDIDAMIRDGARRGDLHSQHDPEKTWEQTRTIGGTGIWIGQCWCAATRRVSKKYR
jgi:hypothetical protein